MPAYKPVLDRFVEKFELNRETGCWEWKAAIHKNGYGMFGPGNGKIHTAHRESWLTFMGEIPKGHEIHHKCQCRHCVAPHHLELQASRATHMRKHYALRTHCENGHEYKDGSYYVRKSETGLEVRQCKECCRDRNREHHQRHMAVRVLKPNANAAKTHCPRGHEYTAKNTRKDRKGSRMCIKCAAIKSREHNEKIRQAPRGTPKAKCKHGHEMTEENTYIYGGSRSCRKCISYRIQKSREAKRIIVPNIKGEPDNPSGPPANPS